MTTVIIYSYLMKFSFRYRQGEFRNNEVTAQLEYFYGLLIVLLEYTDPHYRFVLVKM